MELKGKIKVINDLSNQNIQKKQVIITLDGGKYPNDVAIDFLKDKVNLLDNARIGNIATVKINIQSREYNSKWYTNVVGWSINLENDLSDLL